MNFSAELRSALAAAQNIAVLTGAGVSAESGIPTFRDAQTGLWAHYRPEELATREAFLVNPQRVWDWYAHRRKIIAEARPNPGHHALAAFEERVPGFTLITQNIDGLHHAAGSRNILELHGSIWRAKCFEYGHPYLHDFTASVQPPACPVCGSLVRPDVVWFGEPLPEHTLQAARQAALTCGLFLLVGTSGLVQPAASLPLIAVEAGAVCIEINPQETNLTPWMTYTLRGKSGEILPGLVDFLGSNN